jgi:transposase
METNAMEQRLSFVVDYESGQWSMSELCERYGITRPTGYKWVGRFGSEGQEGLVERSRAPNGCPHETPEAVVQLLLEARARYGWGAKKLLQVLSKRQPRRAWPARSTVNAILDRHGKLRKNRRRRKWKHPGAAALVTERPNQVWPADFKGQFKTRDGRYCYPLTVSDHLSRKLLLCKGLPSVKTEGADGLALPPGKFERKKPVRVHAPNRRVGFLECGGPCVVDLVVRPHSVVGPLLEPAVGPGGDALAHGAHLLDVRNLKPLRTGGVSLREVADENGLHLFPAA